MNPERIEADFHASTVLCGYRCPVCGYTLDESNGGYLYLSNDRGNRIPLKDHGEHEIIAQMLRTEEEFYDDCGAVTASHEAMIDLIEERVGYLSACICMKCLEQFGLDLRKDTVECPNCKSDHVRTLLEMNDKRCPRCQSGHLTKF
ncbi:MAG: hypothetical protein ACYDHW_04930 [Syntrophorhabdaceae bacterium]